MMTTDISRWFDTNPRIQAVLTAYKLARVYRIPCELRSVFDGYELAYPSIHNCLISISEIGSIFRKHGDKVEIMDEHEHVRIITAEEAAEYLYRFHRYRRMDYKA